MQLTVEHTINIDNQHVAKLIQIIKILMFNQKKLIFTTLISYAVALKNMLI